MLPQQSYQVVFLDLEMPVMDGFACATSLRRWERNRLLSQKGKHDGRQYLCVVSSLSSPKEREQCAQIGFDFFEPKPVRPQLATDSNA